MVNQTPRSPSLTHCMCSNISVSWSAQQTLHENFQTSATVVLFHENRGRATRVVKLGSELQMCSLDKRAFTILMIPYCSLLKPDVENERGLPGQLDFNLHFIPAKWNILMWHRSNLHLNQFDNKPMLHTCPLWAVCGFSFFFLLELLSSWKGQDTGQVMGKKLHYRQRTVATTKKNK